MSRYVYETANMNFRSGQPFVGASAFAHKGGMHTHAVARNTASYEHIDPAAVGNERRILVSELSGQSTILTKTTKYQLTHDRPLMQKILGQVQDLENEGYEFEAAEASFDLLVKKAAGLYQAAVRAAGLPRQHRGRRRTASRSPRRRSRCASAINSCTPSARATARSTPWTARCARRCLPFYPRLAEMHLADYKVRVVNARAETAARVRVVIEWRDGEDVWGTVGVSENIIEASWLALVDAIEYKLFKDEEGKRA